MSEGTLRVLSFVREYMSGAYQCFHCGEIAVIWDSDFSFDDYGMEGDGIVYECHCMNCGASITYCVPFENGDDDATGDRP